MKINIKTQEEEANEETVDNLLCRQKCGDAEQKGDKLGLVKDHTLTPHSEGPKPRKEAEPVTELPVRQETIVLVI